jgi:hypothetical protein
MVSLEIPNGDGGLLEYFLFLTNPMVLLFTGLRNISAQVNLLPT